MQIEPEVLLETGDGITINYRVGGMKYRVLSSEIRVGSRVLPSIRPEDIEVLLERQKDTVNDAGGEVRKDGIFG